MADELFTASAQVRAVNAFVDHLESEGQLESDAACSLRRLLDLIDERVHTTAHTLFCKLGDPAVFAREREQQ